MLVEVTQEEIGMAKRRSVSHCPIALAIRLVLPDRCVRVKNFICFVDHYCIPLPAEVRQFISEFDNGLGVSPFAFTLDWEPEK